MSLPALNTHNNFLFVPQNLREAMDFSKMIADSALCPPAFKGKAGDVLIAVQMGAEVGLSPMQALQNIAVINNRPCLWGDAALAIVQASPLYSSHHEWMEGSEQDGTLTAYCAVTRKGHEEYVKAFSQQDAIKAGLWKKAGVWQQYPGRMLQMRARAFALRDKFADSLRGIGVAEEIGDYQVIDIKAERAKPNFVRQINSVPENKAIKEKIEKEIDEEASMLEIDFQNIIAEIKACASIEELQTLFGEIKRMDFKKRPDLFKKIIDEKDRKKDGLKKQELLKDFNDEYDSETGEIKNEQTIV